MGLWHPGNNPTQGVSLDEICYCKMITLDTSTASWGMVYKGCPAWKSGRCSSHIAHKLPEMFVVFLALNNFLPNLQGCHVVIRTNAFMPHDEACMMHFSLGEGQVPVCQSGAHPRAFEPGCRSSFEARTVAQGVEIASSDCRSDLLGQRWTCSR